VVQVPMADVVQMLMSMRMPKNEPVLKDVVQVLMEVQVPMSMV